MIAQKDLARRQNTVEKMLRETKLYGERLKEEKAERDKATAEKVGTNGCCLAVNCAWNCVRRLLHGAVARASVLME